MLCSLRFNFVLLLGDDLILDFLLQLKDLIGIIFLLDLRLIKLLLRNTHLHLDLVEVFLKRRVLSICLSQFGLKITFIVVSSHGLLD